MLLCGGGEVWIAGVLEARCRCSNVEVWRYCRYRGVESCCRHSDPELWMHGTRKRHCWRGDMEVWSARDALQACRHGDMEIWRLGVAL